MASGGAREGVQGQSYSNRTDLNVNPAKTAAPAPVAAPTAPPAGPQQGPPQAVPGAQGSIFRDSQNPNEPVQAGLPIGPGAGPSTGADPLGMLRAIYQKFPSEGIRLLIQYAETHGTP